MTIIEPEPHPLAENLSKYLAKNHNIAPEASGKYVELLLGEPRDNILEAWGGEMGMKDLETCIQILKKAKTIMQEILEEDDEAAAMEAAAMEPTCALHAELDDDQPEDYQSEDDQQEDDQTDDDQPIDDQPEDDQPEDDQPEDDQPEDDQPEDDQPEDDQPEDDQTEDDQTEM